MYFLDTLWFCKKTIFESFYGFIENTDLFVTRVAKK